MGQFLNPQTFEFFAKYLLAGFVLLSVRARYVQGERPNPTETIVEAVILSLINQFIFLIVFGWTKDYWPGSDVVNRAYLFLEVLVLPASLGLLIGWLFSHEWVPSGLRRLFLPLTKPSENAWDRLFSVGVTPGLLLITYKDGTQIMGFFGQKSYAATAERDRDIYLETLYEMYGEAPEEWIESYPSRSAYVKLDDVRSIEFIKELTDESDDID